MSLLGRPGATYVGLRTHRRSSAVRRQYRFDSAVVVL